MKKNFRKIIKTHVINNIKQYIMVSLIFVIGVFFGVIFVNNISESQNIEVSNYVEQFVDKLKNAEEVDLIGILKSSVLDKTILALVVWFFGTTIVGIPVVLGIIAYRGFCLGYTIAVCIAIMGLSRGLLFVLIICFLQNILFIPALLALAVSGLKLFSEVRKGEGKHKIKIEIIRHSLFSVIMLVALIVSGIVEVFLSTNLLLNLIKYF